MSHSSNLMTLHSVAFQLTDLIDKLSSDGMTIEEYCGLFEVFHKISKLQQYLETCGLTLELQEGEKGEVKPVFYGRRDLSQPVRVV